MLATARKAFCPTGPGGGVDNSCGGQGGSGSGSKVETDDDGRGKVVENEDGSTSYAGVHEDDWQTWAYDSDLVNDALAGNLKAGSLDSSGQEISDEDVEDYKRIGEAINAAASSNAIKQVTVYRGESFASDEEVTARYKSGKWIESDRLTSTATEEDAAAEYHSSDTSGAAKVLVRYGNPNGIVGIQTAPMGVPSNEVVLPIGARYRVSRVFKREDGVHVVDLYSAKKHGLAKVDASKPEKAATARIDEIVAAKMALRAFCPTGEGGGVDNSCGPGGSGSSSEGGAGKPSKVVTEILSQAEKVRFDPSQQASPEIESGDYAAIADSMTNLEQQEMQEEIERQRSEWIAQQMDDMEFDSDEQMEEYESNLWGEFDEEAAEHDYLDEFYTDNEDRFAGGTDIDDDVWGKGEAFEIFSKVVPSIVAYAKEMNPKVMHFSAEGESRQRLYDRLVKTVLAADKSRFAISGGKGKYKHYVVALNEERDVVESALEAAGLKAKGDPDDLPSKWEAVEPEADPAWMTPEGWEDSDEADEKGFCPTGPGGGVDNSCGNDGGGSGVDPYGKGQGKISKEDEKVLYSYTFQDYEIINDVLRDGWFEERDRRPGAADTFKKVDALDRVMEVSTLDADVEVVRWVSSPKTVFDGKQPKVGMTTVDKAFVSTSTDKNYLPVHNPKLKTRLVITVPKGTHARKMSKSWAEHEKELLLDRSLEMTVSKVVKDGATTTVHMKVTGSKKGGGKKAFCATGEGGGIDNSCGSGSSGGGSVSGAIATVLEHTGYSKDQLAKGLNGDASPKNSQAAKMRARVAGSVLLSGKAVKDAINDVLDEHDKAAVNAKVKELTEGNVAAAQKEFGGIPMYDLEVLSAMEVKAGPVQGEAVCYMAERRIVMGSTTRSGSYRHELGHAVRSMLGGESSSGKTQMTKAVAAEYEDAKARFKADPPKPGEKLDHEAYETRYGLVGRRGLDNWEEHFAEHYRLYHREVHRDRNEGGNGKFIKQYRERHPGWAKIWDAHYTAALIGGELAKTKE